MTRFILASMLAGAATFLAPQPAAAQGQRCTVVALSGLGLNTSYNPMDAGPTEAALSLTIEHEGCGNRSLPLRFENSVASSNVVQGTTLSLRPTGGASTDVLVGELSDGRPGRGAITLDLSRGGNPTVADLRLILPAGQRVSPGVYSATVNARILPNGIGTEDGSRFATLTITVRVSPIIGLAAATATELFIPEIRPGATSREPVGFRAYANVPYRLTITTDYGMRMRRSPTEADPSIPYALTVDDRTVATSGAAVDFGLPGVDGFRPHRLDVRVPAGLPLPPAGSYADTITVEISAAP